MAAIEFIQSTNMINTSIINTSKVDCKLFFVENLYNSLSVYNSLSAAIHLHMIRPLL